LFSAKKLQNSAAKKRAMRKLLNNLVLILVLALLPSLSHAQLKELTINADKVSLEKEKHRIEAEGSVEATYRDVILHGQHLVYNTSAETFFADRGFTLLYQGITIEGETLDYQVKEYTGTATKVDFYYQGVELRGGRLDFDPDKYEIKGASFTTCDLPGPHYRVTAADLLLYPKYGWMVAYWGYFWLLNVPVVPMPTYIYDFRAQKNLPPFPEIGYNEEDGNYINESLAWHLRREFSGTYTLSYAANKGIGGGGQANYILDDRNNGNIRLYGNFKDGLYGGATHIFVFGSEIQREKSSLIELFPLPKYRQFELESTLSLRERINYQRVSYTPNFRLRSRAGEILRKEAKYDLELGTGLVAEEGNRRLVYGNAYLKFYGDFQETPVGYIIPSLIADLSHYSNGARWIKPAFELKTAKTLSRDYELDFGYLHYFYVEGASPFNFEMYRFRAADRLRGDLLFKAGETRGKIAASYFLDNWSPEDIDYSLFFTLHCYDLEVTYRSLRKEFLLSFSLAAKQ
jgi:hypothetical protein